MREDEEVEVITDEDVVAVEREEQLMDVPGVGYHTVGLYHDAVAQRRHSE